MSQINLKRLLAGDAQQENIDKLNFNFGQISEFGGGPPGIQGTAGTKGGPGGRGPRGLDGLTGPRGSKWKVIEADPDAANVPNPIENDLAYNRYTGHLFSFVAGVWVDEGKLVQDGTFFERDGSVFYNLPLHQGVVKSIVLAPVDYHTLNINPLTGNFRPNLKMLSNNLSNPFLTFGFIDGVGLEVPRTKQVGMYLDENGAGFDYTLSNASGDIISSAGPNHFKIGTDNTYRFTSSGQLERLTFDLSDVAEKYILFGGEQDGFTKLLFGSEKTSPAMVINDLNRIGINVLDPQTQLHVYGDPLTRDKDSVSTPLILGGDVGGGNASKVHFELNRRVLSVNGFETDSVLTAFRRVDGSKFSAFVGMLGGLTNTAPEVMIGFSNGPNTFSNGHNDETMVSVTKARVKLANVLYVGKSISIGERTGVAGPYSFTVGQLAEASKTGSIALGNGSKSSHANAVVIGDAESVQADSIMLANHVTAKNGAGGFVPVDEAVADYFDSRNTLTAEGSAYKAVTSSVQHDGTVNGLEIVTFGPTGYGPMAFGTQPRQKASGMSFMITGAELDGTHPFNIFSVGYDKVTIGEPATKFNQAAATTPAGSYYFSRYALGLNGSVLFNTKSTDEEVLITRSYVVAPYSLFYPEVVGAAINIKGGTVQAAVGNTARGGSVYLTPGVGSTKDAAGVTYGVVALSPRGEGQVLVGSSYPDGPDTFQAKGGSYFTKGARAGNSITVAVTPPENASQKATGLSGYVKLGNPFIDRSTVETSYTLTGKIAHIWNSESTDGTADVHTTSSAAVYGEISAGSPSNNYAAYFEDLTATSDNRPAVSIRSKGLALSIQGKVDTNSVVSAAEFIPKNGWLHVPFGILTFQAFNGTQAVTTPPAPLGSGHLPLLSGLTRVGTIGSRSITQRVEAFRMGTLVMINFNMYVTFPAATGNLDGIAVAGFPMIVITPTIGTAYVWGTTPDGVVLGQLCPVVSRNGAESGELEIQLPETADWASLRTIHMSGSITLNAQLENMPY